MRPTATACCRQSCDRPLKNKLRRHGDDIWAWDKLHNDIEVCDKHGRASYACPRFVVLSARLAFRDQRSCGTFHVLVCEGLVGAGLAEIAQDAAQDLEGRLLGVLAER